MLCLPQKGTDRRCDVCLEFLVKTTRELGTFFFFFFAGSMNLDLDQRCYVLTCGLVKPASQAKKAACNESLSSIVRYAVVQSNQPGSILRIVR